MSGQRIPESFFLQSSPPISPVVVDRRVSLIPSSFFSPSKQPRCVHRRQVPSPSILPYHSVRSNSSCNQASHASYSDVVRRGMQIFSPCPPRSAVQVSPRRPGRFFAPYQRAKAQAHHHHDSDDDADADSCSTWHTVCHRRAKNSTGKVHGSPLQVGIPSELRLSNRFQELSCDSGFGFDEFDSTPGLAEDVFDVTSSVPQPPHGGVTVRSAKFRSCNGSLHGSRSLSASSRDVSVL